MESDPAPRVDEPSPLSKKWQTHIGRHLLIAFFLAYATVVVLSLAKELELQSIGKGTFLFFLSLFFPLVAIRYYPFSLILVFLFALLFAIEMRYAPVKFRPFLLAVTIVAWELYGAYCVNLIAP